MDNINVIKRNNKKSPLDISKIRKQSKAAVAGLSGVDFNELELDAKIQFRDCITTEEIQQTLIKTAVEKIDIDRPNWSFVAARLSLFEMYHKVGRKLGGEKGNPYSHTIRSYIEYGVENEILHPKLLNESIFDLDKLNTIIKPERDFILTYMSIKMLKDRYLQKDKSGELFELPQHLFMAVSMWLASNEKEPMKWVEKFYNLISKLEVMVATPTLSNARLNRHQLSSCYAGVTSDNIEDIFDVYKEMSLLSKYGGGIGWDWTNIRSSGSIIDTKKGASGGLIPWMKLTNDLGISVDQLGTRPGSIAVYVEPWHADIFDFLDLKKNSGEERRRAHDLFPALWIPDLFLERVSKNEEWSLFDPLTTPELHSKYGKEFEELYIKHEKEGKAIETVSAKELWKKILTEYYETGNPFLCFKDEHNRRNQNKHIGTINSSNLCTEISQVTAQAEYAIKVEFCDRGPLYFDMEDVVVTVQNGITYEKKAKRLTSEDKIDGVNNPISHVSREIKKDRRTLVCNLASVNLSKIHTEEDFERVIPIAIRMLDNVIDLNFYPVRNTKETNTKSRAIGLGFMGEAQMLAEKQIVFGTQEHFDFINKLYENASFKVIEASAKLAQEKGVYPEFENSEWSKGVLPIDTQNKEVKTLTEIDNHLDWNRIREEVKKGMRNGYLMAIAPTGSISLIAGTSQTIEPIYKRKWYEENKSGLIPMVAPNLSPETYMYYKTVEEVDMLDVVKAGAIRQKWIDQAQSLNIFVNPENITGKKLNNIYIVGHKYGNKSFYYLRSKSPEEKKGKEVMDRSMECAGCQ